MMDARLKVAEGAERGRSMSVIRSEEALRAASGEEVPGLKEKNITHNNPQVGLHFCIQFAGEASRIIGTARLTDDARKFALSTDLSTACDYEEIL